MKHPFPPVPTPMYYINNVFIFSNYNSHVVRINKLLFRHSINNLI